MGGDSPDMEIDGDVLSMTSSGSDGDSSFYGNQELRQRYERRAREVDGDAYWRVHDWNVQVIATRAVERDPKVWVGYVHGVGSKRKRDHDGGEKQGEDVKKSKIKTVDSSSHKPLPVARSRPTTPFNSYEGDDTALQIDESIDSFLSRLRPSSADTLDPWITCANFYSGERPTEPDIAGFKQIGTRLLDKFLMKRQKLEAQFDPLKTEGVITRMMASDRAELESGIMSAAKKHKLVNGKWMLFPTTNKVDQYWEAVVRGTVEGRLGTAAKVATRPEKPDEPTQLICIYTKDVNDEEDIKRVLLELVRLKLAPAVVDKGLKKGFLKGQIWYKPDCYTYLDITSGNEYKIKPTLYGTASLLTATDVQKLS